MTWKRLTGPGFVQDPEGPGGGKLAARAQPQGWAREGSRCREATRETYGRHPSPRLTGTLCRAGTRAHSEWGEGRRCGVCIPYLLPEQQGRDQDAQHSQEASKARQQELLGAPHGLSVPCV